MDDNFETNLKHIGLSDKEARVYLAVLELGPATALQIAQKASINRPTAYVQIESLTRLGLMSSYVKGKKRYFSVESPERLEELIKVKKSEIEEKEKRLLEILPDLKLLFDTSGERPTVRFYEGKMGIGAIQDDIFKKGNKEILSFYSADFYEEFFTEEEKSEFRNLRVKRNIKARSLYTRTSGPYAESPPAGVSDKFIPEDKFPFSAGIDIYNNKIAIHSLKGKIAGAIIESSYIADTMRSIFELAWESADKYQKHKN